MNCKIIKGDKGNLGNLYGHLEGIVLKIGLFNYEIGLKNGKILKCRKKLLVKNNSETWVDIYHGIPYSDIKKKEKNETPKLDN